MRWVWLCLLLAGCASTPTQDYGTPMPPQTPEDCQHLTPTESGRERCVDRQGFIWYGP